MQFAEVIARKRDGGALASQTIENTVKAFTRGEIPDYQMAAFLMAVFFRGMSPEETSSLTNAMWKSGETLPRKNRADYWIDKHSTGGVGDKPSLILVPLVTAVCRRHLGKGAVRIPMISGRGLGHSGGTLDKLEAVRGFSTRIPEERALELLEKNDFFMMGQTDAIAPADRKLYALRDVTATVECLPLIVSSIMSKKLSENLDGLVFDVKFGEGAFMTTLEQARALGLALCETARLQRLDAVAVLTSMEEPLGWTVGNALEIEEAAAFVRGERQEPGLRRVTLELAAWMVHLGSRRQMGVEEARRACEAELSHGTVLPLFVDMLEAQGGDWDGFERRKRPCLIHEIKAPRAGEIERMNAKTFGLLLNAIGGGRAKKEDDVDPEVGMTILKKRGDRVDAGEPIVRVHHRHKDDVPAIESALATAIQIGSAGEQNHWVKEILR